MGSICEDILIARTPEDVWDAIRDVGNVHRRLVRDQVVDATMDGDVRILTFSSGGMARELIVAVDEEARRMAYSVIGGPMPLTHHHASFQVFSAGEKNSRLVCITDFLPNELVEEVRLRVERLARTMKQTLEASTL
ncbi:MAG TPA: SRPBCC family protein [Allocoleopsis sp.]